MSSTLARIVVVGGLLLVAGVNVLAPRLGVVPTPSTHRAAPIVTDGPRLIPVPPGR